jgi:hypothetical protein
MVKDAEPFSTVAEAFINFMQQQADTYSAAKGFPVEHLILVGHNGKSFDTHSLSSNCHQTIWQMCSSGIKDLVWVLILCKLLDRQ